MNPYLLDPWEPFAKIECDGQTYEVLSHTVMEDDFVNRKRFMVKFPDGKKRMLYISISKAAIEDYEAHCGPGGHAKIIQEVVTAEVLKEIKAVAKAVSLPPVTPNVQLVPLDMEPPLAYSGVDFAKVESEMMAHLLEKLKLPKGAIHGPPLFLGSAQAVVKMQKAMEKTFKQMAADYIPSLVPLDSLAGLSKEEVFKVLYGGQPGPTELTPKGLATLKRFGVALAG